MFSVSPVNFLIEQLSSVLESSMLRHELRWGILGCGEISHDFVTAMRLCTHTNLVSALFSVVHV